jgi:UDP-glucose 6-dehydrogenase
MEPVNNADVPNLINKFKNGDASAHILEEKTILDKHQQRKFFHLIKNAMAKEGR